MTQGRVRAFLTLFLLMLTAGCEVPTTVRVGDGPSFSFHGTGQLASFRVYSPQPGHKIATPFDEKSLVWRVEPIEGYFKGTRVQGLNVAYGTLPKGYTQTVPKNAAPTALSQGQVYYFFAETTNAPPAGVLSILTAANQSKLPSPTCAKAVLLVT